MPKPQVANHHPVACHAPPLTDELLARYADLVIQGQMPARTRDAFAACLRCAEEWWKLPASKRTDVTRWESRTPAGKKLTFAEVPLEEPHVAALDPVTPWPDECQLYGQLFDALPNGTPAEKELRNAAHHLLWHAKEITLDREPLTSDVLQPA